MNKHEIGQKVWDTHNNYIYTLKSSKQVYGTTMWRVEENDFEWREDWFSDIPRYVQDLITKAKATEKELEEKKIVIRMCFDKLKKEKQKVLNTNIKLKATEKELQSIKKLCKDLNKYGNSSKSDDIDCFDNTLRTLMKVGNKNAND